MTVQQTQIEPSGSCSSAELGLVAVPPESVWELSPVLIPVLKRATDRSRGRAIPEDLLLEASNEQAQIWCACGKDGEILGVLVTSVIDHPGHRICELRYLAGHDMHRWFHFLEHIEEWARDNGVTMMEARGRTGFGRLLKDYEEDHRVWVKEI